MIDIAVKEMQKEITTMTDRTYPFMNGIKKGIKVKENAFAPYFEEAEKMGEEKIHKMLDQGKFWSKRLSQTLLLQGSAIFPHTFLSKCGDQIAAVVEACLDTGADQVLALGVMHPISENLMQARTNEFNGKPINEENSWGVLGPVFPGDSCWEKEFSLFHFKTLWNASVKRRGIKSPKLIECYPSLTNRCPQSLPNIKELEKIAKDSIVVATDDMCHHGIGYGVDRENAIEIDQGYEFAHKTIEEGFVHLQNGNYAKYYDHWMNSRAIGDPTDCAMVLRHLLGESSFTILDLKLVDVAELFEENDSPSWVAATLVEVKKSIMQKTAI